MLIRRSADNESAECGGGHGPGTIIKHLNYHKRLQQDKFYQQQLRAESSNSKIPSGFKSPAKASNIQHLPCLASSSDSLANEFFRRQKCRSPLGKPLMSFQSQKPPSLLLFQQHHSRIIVQQQDDWAREFSYSQLTTPSYDDFDHIYQRHNTNKSPLLSRTAEDFYQHQNHHVASSDVSEEDQQLAFERAFEEVIVVSAAEQDHLQCSRDWGKEFEDHEPWKEDAKADDRVIRQQHRTYIDRSNFFVVPSSASTMLDVPMTSSIASQQNQAPVVIESYARAEECKEEREKSEEMRVWNRLQPEGKPYGYRAIHPDHDIYHHTTDNPYLTHQDAIDGMPHPSLADAILALEAKSQLHRKDAKTWEQLGLKQQENERDGAAITALEKAVSLDPTNCLDAWLALAISYTNEHCRMDAYSCLEQWITCKYKRLLHHPLGQNYNHPDKRHAYITHLFLEAARIAPIEMDADVQIALGVLFNMSEEYAKAVDCFKAALVSRPTDYQLWNKLGATLANSHDSLGAIEMYSQALQINPLYVRARYNMAISCMNLGQHLEAAENFLTALTLQREAVISAGQQAARAHHAFVEGAMEIPNGTSNSIWDSLRILMYMINREDLAAQCNHRNLDAFQGQFDF